MFAAVGPEIRKLGCLEGIGGFLSYPTGAEWTLLLASYRRFYLRVAARS
ncbi:hypothetical protein OAE21_00290 [Rubripirellula sp.]|nr:hypothetical protein [Rubripirellula sp.]